MVTDKMLQQAAEEVEFAILSSLSTKNVEPHHFSAPFEKKMKKLINRVNHPIRYNILRSAVAIILIVFTLFGSLVAFSPKVRASVIDWFKETFFEFFQYSSPGDIEPTEYKYHFAAPEGYKELQVIDSKDGKTFLYADKNGHILQFSYVQGDRANNFFVKTDLHSHYDGFVNGNKADIFITESDQETNAIVWHDNETNTLLCISAKVEQYLLIAFAESITKTTE